MDGHDKDRLDMEVRVGSANDLSMSRYVLIINLYLYDSSCQDAASAAAAAADDFWPRSQVVETRKCLLYTVFSTLNLI